MKWPLTFASVVVAFGASASRADEPPDALPTPPPGKSWKLVWHDEFDGDTLDENRWEVPPDGRRRDGWWKRRAISLDGKGRLAISTLDENGQYMDGCVRTKGKFEHTFGYYVARIALQREPGHWSAFWLMGDGVMKVGEEGRNGTEIDIMEKPWLDDRVQHTLHWDGYGKHHRSEGKVARVPGVMDGFHTFALLWTPEEYVFYVDGEETWRTQAGGVCQVPLYLKLSDEVGEWGGDIRQAHLPDRFLVDYVRVYNLVDEQPEPKFVKLFDGRSLKGWHALPGGKWEVKDGVLVGTGDKSESRHGLLVSDATYGDFIARLKFRAVSGNSGFYFRSEKVDNPVAVFGFQAEIHNDEDSGGLYETGGRAWVVQPEPSLVRPHFRHGDWNELTIEARGGNVVVKLNGVETARLRDDSGRSKGHFALQLHGGEDMKVMFKDIEVAVLD
jgi:beta-glucanase (GH16 family)